MAREMKDSGIEWIGKIPKDWEIRKLKTCILQRDSGAWGNEAGGNENDTICLRIADFNYAMFKFKDTEERLLTKRSYNEEIIKKLILQKDDIVIEKSGGGEKTPVGRTVIFDKDYKAVYANFCDRLRCRKTVLPWFMQYIFVVFYLNGYVWNYIKQTTGIQNLDLTAMLSSEKVAIPSLVEQQRIIDFLKVSCKEVDNVIEKTRASIEEYKKLKQAVITQVVTKGVRGDREMKNSGNIRWGKIPSNWELTKIKNCITDLKSGLSAVTDDENAEESGYYVLRTSAVSSGVFLPEEVKPVLASAVNRLVCPVEKGTIIVSRMNTSAMVGTCAYVDNEYPNLFLPDKLWKIHIKKEYCAKYFWYAINSTPTRSLFNEISTGASMSMQNISVNDFVDNYVTVPTTDEQREIVHYLDEKCVRLDDLILKKEKYLVELETYKRSLIYEYVTGKKEVSQEY